MSTILIILLVLFLIGALPTWNYSRSWGWSPVAMIVVIAVLFLLFGGRF